MLLELTGTKLVHLDTIDVHLIEIEEMSKSGVINFSVQKHLEKILMTSQLLLMDLITSMTIT